MLHFIAFLLSICIVTLLLRTTVRSWADISILTLNEGELLTIINSKVRQEGDGMAGRHWVVLSMLVQCCVGSKKQDECVKFLNYYKKSLSN